MAKKEKSKLPKTIAGVKVPDAVKHSNWIAAALASPVVREAVSAALVAGAAAAAAVIAKHAPSAEDAKKAGAAVADTAGDAASATKDLTQVAVGALAGLATDAAKSMLSSRGKSKAAAAAARTDMPNGGKRKPRAEVDPISPDEA